MGDLETPDVTIKVSVELLDWLGDWSPPVRMKIEKLSTGDYMLTAMSHVCPLEGELRNGVQAQ